MTTAHRPTWTPAIGGGTARDQGKTFQYSSRDLPSELTLKTRKRAPGDEADEYDRLDLKEDLLRKERESRAKRRKENGLDVDIIRDDEKESLPGVGSSGLNLVDDATAALDADDKDSDDDEDDSDDDDSDDDEAELLRELENIKRERAEEQAEKDAEEREEQDRIRTESLMQGNPLLHENRDFAVKKRWDDDVIFKNCARGLNDKKEQTYINDTIRSEFHRRFMKKYVQ
ncbi:hypothetical protein SARC_03921 [Sphaeroforma arctica JP610]|uniref:Cwf15/Cwc15 cell cycle control protein n=1 Tax=Sphaeroforma arctica JP610 TaxID=667725 RepID=A0A0L0G4L3_9EUKA|nr:hypothetical protein SARC_03921 [Sphaeroforma arctica JP610]KNC83839.1 hypothetical protein SARC_03921 [Sphaeroforma arctica JP610]|eukprot:XP_014157741.1 hypothetical protein SARC_03921 [Sphaeroforma arctica JP610]